MKKLFSITILLCISFIIRAQDHPVKPEAKSFIPKGYKSFDYITGDLNGDKKPDAILVLRHILPDSSQTDNSDSTEIDYSKSTILLLVRQADGKLKQVIQSDSAIMCSECGGVWGDPYGDIKIINNGFNLFFYGGSYWRWGYDYRFDWKPAKKNWYLVREIQTSTHVVGNPETKKTVIEENELGEIPLSRFSSSLDGEERRWKVKAAKTFFYNTPKLGSIPRKGYLLKGNEVTSYRQFTNFVEVSFDNGKGGYSDGYILKKDLEKIN